MYDDEVVASTLHVMYVVLVCNTSTLLKRLCASITTLLNKMFLTCVTVRRQRQSVAPHVTMNIMFSVTHR
jgi:hypothetical protein